MMQAVSKLDVHLQGNEQSDGFRRRFAARLDMTMKRARITSRRLASYLGVNEPEVVLWRAGITLPHGGQCRRLSQLLQVDVAWLCLAPGLALRGFGKAFRVMVEGSMTPFAKAAATLAACIGTFAVVVSLLERLAG